MEQVFYLRTKEPYAEALIRHLLSEGAVEEILEETMVVSKERMGMILEERENYTNGNGVSLTWEEVQKKARLGGK